MKAKRGDDGASSDSIAPSRAFAAAFLAEVTKWYASEHVQLTVRLSRDRQAVSA
jgi:hypothetical protein